MERDGHMQNRIPTILGALLSLCATITLAQAEEHVVQMLNKSKAKSDEVMVFEPDFIRAKIGDTIRFVPADRNHNAEAIAEIWPEGAEPLKGKLSEEAVLTVAKDGVYGVKCLPHYGLGMVAMVVAGAPDVEKLKAARFPSGRLGKRMAELIEKATH